jgi:hypothetical protein
MALQRAASRIPTPDTSPEATNGKQSVDAVGSNITRQIAAIVSQGGYSKTNRFTFEFTNMNAAVNERLVRNCISLSIPGRSIQSQPHKIYGPPREFPYEANYVNELQMTFRVGLDMFERDMFERWAGHIISPITSDLIYPDQYRVSLKIYQLDPLDNKTYGVELYDVFCKSIGEMELNTEAQDQFSTVNVTLSYSEYHVIGRIFPRGDVPPPEENTLLSNLNNFVQKAQVQQIVPNAIFRNR